jgi:ribosomal protein S18 acetylase RimI-like enzyme
MKYRITYLPDTEEARALHKLAFGGDKWPGDDHEFWIAKDSSGSVAGFASAVFVTGTTLFLSRAAVARKHEGNGLHRQMITRRLKWGTEHGARLAVTYVEKHNYPSMLNLIKLGFRFVPKELWPSGYSDTHIMWKLLDGDDPSETELKVSIQAMDHEVDG